MNTKTANISDEAVQKATGKVWQEWFTLLDKAGAKKMNHQKIVALLSEHHNVGGWWQQMITVTYEQSRGLRDKHQKTDGYSVSGSRVIAVPIATLYKAWNDKRTRKHWLDTDFTIRKATENKSLRITWTDGTTNVNVNLYEKGEGKAQVAIEHNKLATADEAAKMKAYWAAALDRLKETLEK